jgi:hypothetical protein
MSSGGKRDVLMPAADAFAAGSMMLTGFAGEGRSTCCTGQDRIVGEARG